MAIKRVVQRVNDGTNQSNLISVALLKALNIDDDVNIKMSVDEVAELIAENIGGGGGTGVVDDHLSLTSKNPVQNKVITKALQDDTAQILHEAPTKDNDEDKLSIVVLENEPTHKYNGYIYAIQNGEETTFNGFQVGQVLGNGQKIHFDTSKASELLAFLQTLDYSSDTEQPLIDIGHEFIMASVDDGSMPNLYAIIDYQNNHTILYCSMAIEGYCVEGFNNLDANGDYTLVLGENQTIDGINDTTPPTWNGIILGTQTSVPGSYMLYYGNKQIATLDNVYTKAQAQEKLVSGSNIKTIGGESILGPGNIVKVPLADNLYSADSQTDVSQFIVRTSGGEASIETGEATLVRMEGNSTVPEHIEEVLNFSHSEAQRLSGSIDLEVWQTSDLGTTSGTYSFYYDETQESWTLNGEAVSLATYGISISGTPISGDSVVIDYSYNSEDPTQSTINASINERDRLNVTLNATTWRSYVNASGTYDFNYDGSDWKSGGGLSAFYVGQTLSNGDKIRFDNTFNWNSFLSNLTYSPVGESLLIGRSGDPGFVILAYDTLRAELTEEQGYLIVLDDGDTHSLFGYSTIAIPELNIGVGWNIQGGVIDSNYDFTIQGNMTITEINDTTPPTWNGVIIGIGGSATTVDLADYGITVTGTPIANDEIVVNYTKADFGTIVNATPTSFKSIGFNLYDHTTGWARVVGSEDGQWYNVKGTYTSLEFYTDKTGTGTSITPTTYTIGSYSTNSGFPIYQDGYVKVTGGNNTDTMINLIWSGYMIDAEYQAYAEDTISIPTTDASSNPLPTQLRAIGDTRDVINFDLDTWVKKIDTAVYSQATLEAMLSEHPTWVEGVDYEWDNSYIYFVSATPTTYQLSSTITGIYDVDDFGIEEVLGTDIAVTCAILYGQNLKDKLRRDVLTIGQQTLTPEQQQQVWQNLGIQPIGNTQF